MVSCDSDRPHIVFILADDLGWDDVSFHGSSQIPTPYIDMLAYEGIILNNYYVQPICTPTRSAIMTGRHPIHTGMQHDVIIAGQPYGLGLDNKLLPQYLRESGYTTHIVGKWHLGMHTESHLPLQRGFDSHYGYLQGASDYWKHIMPYTYKKVRGEGLDFYDNNNLVWNETGHYSTKLYNNRVQEIVADHDPEQPMFLYMAHQAVHSGVGGAPLEAPQEYIDRFSHIQDKNRRIFAAMASALDDAVGNLTLALHMKGMLNNTVIVFSTDNGGPAHGFNVNSACNWPLRGVKSTLWEGGTRGVGFVWSPLLKNSGYVSEHMMHVTDWLPTLTKAAGYDMHSLPKNLDGLDMWDTLSEKREESPRTEILYNIDPLQSPKQQGIRVGDMKLLKGVKKSWSDWYPPPQVTQDRLDGPTEFLDNIIFKYSQEEFGVHLAHEERRQVREMGKVLQSLRHGEKHRKPQPVVVACGAKPTNASTNCDSVHAPCLYNIATDPCEFYNIAADFPEIVAKLETRLAEYDATAVSPRNKPFDPNSLPVYHDGAWVPWLNDTSFVF